MNRGVPWRQKLRIATANSIHSRKTGARAMICTPAMWLFCAVLLWASTEAKTLHADRIYDVRGYGAVGNGAALDTAAIQKAIRAANAGGGGTVFFGPGVYKSGTIELLSNVVLDVEAGADGIGIARH